MGVSVQMRLVTFEVDGPTGPVQRVGALDGEDVIDLAAAHQARVADLPPGRRGGPAFPSTMLELLGLEDFGLEVAASAFGVRCRARNRSIHGRRG